LISLLINSFAPVAILILIGYISAKKSIFSIEDSIAIIKYVGVVAVPVLTLKVILSINVSNVNWILFFSYVISELIVYTTTIFIAKYIFNLKWNEAILIGMASSFANHILFVHPIALNEYSADLINPIVTIIGFDVVFLVVNLIILDLIKFKSLKLKNVFIKQFSNLPLLALILGFIIISLKIEIPVSVDRALEFIANSAAPCALFAAGIILSQKIEKTQIKTSNLIILFKIICHPILLIFIILNLDNIDFSLAETTIMVASAPVGLMALVFSTQYGVNPNAITRALMITTLFSIITVPLASMFG
tara:strand:+ start:19 stop:933 length:915 start_codon:yes stop_codon:yes gene_type:complete